MRAPAELKGRKKKKCDGVGKKKKKKNSQCKGGGNQSSFQSLGLQLHVSSSNEVNQSCVHFVVTVY